MFRILLLFFMSFSICYGQKTNPNYDATLAKQLKSDAYGMKSYVFVVLKTGKNTTSDKQFIKDCFNGHMLNISKLADAKKLIIAGPFTKNEADFRGIFILDVPSIEEAKQLLQTDPAVHADLLSATYFSWYGSAALSEYLPLHDKIWEKGF